jgi:hypothetical protein
MTDHIFISYSKKDSDFAHKLADDLVAAGFKTWIDRSIGGGDLWRETIEKNLKAALLQLESIVDELGERI